MAAFTMIINIYLYKFRNGVLKDDSEITNPLAPPAIAPLSISDNKYILFVFPLFYFFNYLDSDRIHTYVPSVTILLFIIIFISFICTV